jgi:hypothetical protein
VSHEWCVVVALLGGIVAGSRLGFWCGQRRVYAAMHSLVADGELTLTEKGAALAYRDTKGGR